MLDELKLLTKLSAMSTNIDLILILISCLYDLVSE